MTAGDDDLLRNFLRTRKEMFDSEIGEDFDYSDFFTEGFVATCANLHPRAFGKFFFFRSQKISLSFSRYEIPKLTHFALEHRYRATRRRNIFKTENQVRRVCEQG